MCFNFLHGQDVLLPAIDFRPDLGPTHSPIQRVTEDHSPGIKQTKREDDLSPPSSTEVK
jgi:hypothetical protein